MIDRSFRLRRSKLFVPGDRPDMMRKALATQADCLSLDLEDSVHESRKAEARRAVREFLREVETDKEIVIRVNALSSNYFYDDLLETLCARVDVINLPKVDGPDDIAACAKFLSYVERRLDLAPRARLMATIETAQGLAAVERIAHATERLASLQLGLGDLFSKNRIERSDATSSHVRGVLRLAAATADLDAFDTAYLGARDAAGFERDAQEAAAWGYCGKSCIHPRQVPIANSVFMPSMARIEKARVVVREYEARAAAGVGAFAIDGRLIDLPLYHEAKSLVDLAGDIQEAQT